MPNTVSSPLPSPQAHKAYLESTEHRTNTFRTLTKDDAKAALKIERQMRKLVRLQVGGGVLIDVLCFARCTVLCYVVCNPLPQEALPHRSTYAWRRWVLNKSIPATYGR